jgi:Flp pilus assembly protein TadG
MNLSLSPSVIRIRTRHGQALVELVLTITSLLLLLGGIVDLGRMLDYHLSITNASRQGAIAAALSGSNVLADCNALAAIALTTQNRPGLVISRIVIYQSGSDGLPLGGSQSTAYTNIYNGNPGCPNSNTPPTPQTANWPSTIRSSGVSLGIEIDYSYQWQTLLLGLPSISIIDRAVMPINIQ